MIQDSGNRREFSTGAVRDIAEGKGRCDLLPLSVVAELSHSSVLKDIALFLDTGETQYIYHCLTDFCNNMFGGIATAMLEVSIHYEEGAKKYAERNWEVGLPCHSFIDSGVRHYLKHIRGDKDEPHDRAFVWNMMGLLWTLKYKPELNDLPTPVKKIVVSVEEETNNENHSKWR